jgi:amino acid adenylation domain-containing protein
MTDLNKRIEQLSAGRQALLSKLLRTKAPENAELQRIPCRPRSAVCPLSFGQQRLWFIDQLEPGNAAFNVAGAVRMRGRLRKAALQGAVEEVVRRHEVLRTRFGEEEGRGVQVIEADGELSMQEVDVSGVGGGEGVARRLAEEERDRGFDLGRGPLLRMRLIRLDEEDHVALWTMHHVVSDGWSMGVLVREVASLYAASTRGVESPLPELVVQYGDYAVWQREWMGGEVMGAQVAYWKEQLEGAQWVLKLPADRARPREQSYGGRSVSFGLGQELTAELNELSLREGVTLFMTLLGGFKVLLQRYTGEDDIVVGTNIANRNRGEIEGLIGFFVNNLVLRTDLGDRPTFVELLGRVREVALGAYGHQDMPFEKLVEEMRPERDLSRTPLFQVVFTLQNAGQEEMELEGLKLGMMEVEGNRAQFDWVINLSEGETGIEGTLIYSTDIFEEQTVGRVVEQYRRLLRGVSEDAGKRVGQYSLLSAGEREETIYGWNETKREYGDQPIQSLFEEQAERRSDRIAVKEGEEEISYGHLNARANQLGRYLQGEGIGRGDVVGLYLGNGIGLVIGVLAIMKAGAGYVMLEPRHPRQRLRKIIEDGGMRVIVSEGKLATQERAEVSRGVKVINIDEDWQGIGAHSEENLGIAVSLGEIAYVIYTSGSSGAPKGVMITHGGLVNYVSWACEEYLKGETLDFPLFTTMAFDLTVTCFYTPLVTGNRVVVYGQEGRGTPIEEVIDEGEVGVVKLTPSQMKLIKGRDNRGSGVQRLIVGGEALETELAVGVAESFGGEVEIYNEYGPTEATVGCMEYRYERGSDKREAVPIGRPAGNHGIYILDEEGEAIGELELGEVYISGAGLAQGYVNREEETAERLLANPYRVGERLYRSGDVARRLVNGEIEYVGRRDEQVKYRGHRVEKEEIRRAVNSHPRIRDSVVVLGREKEGEEELIVYYVARREVAEDEIRGYVRERIIEETVPTQFVQVKRIPLTLNGKINYEGLAALAGQGHERRGGRNGRRANTVGCTGIEEIVGGIWEEVLGVEGIGVEENFFEIGGHSLLATQVVSRIRERVGVEIGLRSVFEGRTVRGMAARVEAALRGGREFERPQIAPARADAPLPLSYAQQRLWFIDQVKPDSSVYNLPNAVRLDGDLSIPAFEYSLSEITRRHETLRTNFRMIDGRPVQIISQAEPVTIPTVDLPELSEERRETVLARIAKKEGLRPFDLARDRLLRVTLLRLRDQEHVVLLTMHHIITDGWSMSILIKEMAALYEAFLSGRQSPLPDLPIQYADYSVWQHGWLRSQVLEDHLVYWRQQLGDELPASEIATDRPRPSIQTFREEAEPIAFTIEMLKGLRKLSSAEGVTLYMTLLSALSVLLHRYTQEQSVVIGSSIANRNRIETEGLIGLFVNLLVLRSDLSGDPTFAELLRRVRDVCFGMQAYQDLPFQKLVEELHPHRDLSRNPLFQMVFVLQNAPSGSIELPNLVLKPVIVDVGTIPFDLILSLGEQPDGLFGSLIYNADLFNRSRMKRMVGHYESLLKGILTDPGQRISSLRLMNEEETAGLTAAHFPKANLSQKQFEDLLLAINNTTNQG